MHKQSWFHSEEKRNKIAWCNWFIFFNCILFILVATGYIFIVPWPEQLLGRLYFIITLISHISFIILSVYLITIFPLIFIINNCKVFTFIACIIATIGCTLLLCDMRVFSQFKFHLSFLVTPLLIDPDSGKLLDIWQVLFIPIPLILLFELLLANTLWYKIRLFSRQTWLKFVGFSITVLFICSHLLFAIADATLYRPITEQGSYFPLSYPMHARTFLASNNFIDLEQHKQNIEKYGSLHAGRITYPRKPLIYQQELAKNFNIVLIQINGLTNEALTTENTPRLHKYAVENNYFINNYAGSNLLTGNLTSLLYGLHANYQDNLLRAKIKPVLLDALEHYNYQINLYDNANMTNNYLYKNIFGTNIFGRQYQETSSLINDWLEQHQTVTTKPWFDYINFSLSNSPNQQELIYIDYYINKILQTLVNNKDIENTVVIITGNIYTERSSKIIPSKLKGPLVILWPNIKLGKIDKLTTNIDIVPTIMQRIFAVKNNSIDYSHGEDIFDTKHTSIMISNKNWRVVALNNGTFYYLSNNGRYYETDSQRNKLNKEKTELGILLQELQHNQIFFKH